MGVAVEESPELVLELREFLLTWVSLVPFDVVVQHVNRLWFEKLAQFRVLVDEIPEPHFLDVGVNALVSHSGVEHGQWEESQHLESD